MSPANATLLTPVLDLHGEWKGVLVHGGDFPAAGEKIRVALPGLQVFSTGDPTLACAVTCEADLAAARQSGATHLAGPYLTHPPPDPAHKQDAGKAVLMQLLALVTQDADSAEIEKVFKREPSLSFHLFRLVNSPGMGMSGHINSFNQAIMVLGRRQLQRWIQLLLYASRHDAQGGPLLIFAALRGALMEKLQAANGGDAGQRELAFMTGIFSLLDSLLGMPLPEIAGSIRLPETVQAALLSRTGELGTWLSWVEDVQAGIPCDLPSGLTAEQCLDIQLEAMAWGRDVGTGMTQGAPA